MKKCFVFFLALIFATNFIFADEPEIIGIIKRDDISENEKVELIKKAIENGANVEERDENKDTSLHWASAKGDLNVLQEILKQEYIDINIRGKWLYTPLHWAARKGHLSIIKELLKNGADVNAVNKNGLTPLGNAILSELSLIFKEETKFFTKYKLLSLEDRKKVNTEKEIRKIKSRVCKKLINCCQILINAGADVDVLYSSDIRKIKNEEIKNLIKSKFGAVKKLKYFCNGLLDYLQ